jgi:hypothetical protein
MPGPLDGDGQFTLMPGAIAGHPLGQYLAAFRYELAQSAGILEFDMLNLIGTKRTDFTPRTSLPHRAGTVTVTTVPAATSHFCHGLLSFLKMGQAMKQNASMPCQKSFDQGQRRN